MTNLEDVRYKLDSTIYLGKGDIVNDNVMLDFPLSDALSGTKFIGVHYKKPSEFMKGTIDFYSTINPTCLELGAGRSDWIVNALKALCLTPDVIKNLFFPEDAEGAHGDNRIYRVKLFNPEEMKWVVVKVDNRIPCMRSNDGKIVPIFIRPKSNSIWPLLLEKAIARLLGNYGKIESGYEVMAFRILTGQSQQYYWRRAASMWREYIIDGDVESAEPQLSSYNSIWRLNASNRLGEEEQKAVMNLLKTPMYRCLETYMKIMIEDIQKFNEEQHKFKIGKSAQSTFNFRIDSDNFLQAMHAFLKFHVVNVVHKLDSESEKFADGVDFVAYCISTNCLTPANEFIGFCLLLNKNQNLVEDHSTDIFTSFVDNDLLKKQEKILSVFADYSSSFLNNCDLESLTESDGLSIFRNLVTERGRKTIIETLPSSAHLDTYDEDFDFSDSEDEGEDSEVEDDDIPVNEDDMELDAGLASMAKRICRPLSVLDQDDPKDDQFLKYQFQRQLSMKHSKFPSGLAIKDTIAKLKAKKVLRAECAATKRDAADTFNHHRSNLNNAKRDGVFDLEEYMKDVSTAEEALKEATSNELHLKEDCRALFMKYKELMRRFSQDLIEDLKKNDCAWVRENEHYVIFREMPVFFKLRQEDGILRKVYRALNAIFDKLEEYRKARMEPDFEAIYKLCFNSVLRSQINEFAKCFLPHLSLADDPEEVTPENVRGPSCLEELVWTPNLPKLKRERKYLRHTALEKINYEDTVSSFFSSFSQFSKIFFETDNPSFFDRFSKKRYSEAIEKIIAYKSDLEKYIVGLNKIIISWSVANVALDAREPESDDGKDKTPYFDILNDVLYQVQNSNTSSFRVGAMELDPVAFSAFVHEDSFFERLNNPELNSMLPPCTKPKVTPSMLGECGATFFDRLQCVVAGGFPTSAAIDGQYVNEVSDGGNSDGGGSDSDDYATNFVTEQIVNKYIKRIKRLLLNVRTVLDIHPDNINASQFSNAQEIANLLFNEEKSADSGDVSPTKRSEMLECPNKLVNEYCRRSHLRDALVACKKNLLKSYRLRALLPKLEGVTDANLIEAQKYATAMFSDFTSKMSVWYPVYLNDFDLVAINAVEVPESDVFAELYPLSDFKDHELWSDDELVSVLSDVRLYSGGTLSKKIDVSKINYAVKKKLADNQDPSLKKLKYERPDGLISKMSYPITDVVQFRVSVALVKDLLAKTKAKIDADDIASSMLKFLKFTPNYQSPENKNFTSYRGNLAELQLFAMELEDAISKDPSDVKADISKWQDLRYEMISLIHKHFPFVTVSEFKKLEKLDSQSILWRKVYDNYIYGRNCVKIFREYIQSEIHRKQEAAQRFNSPSRTNADGGAHLHSDANLFDKDPVIDQWKMKDVIQDYDRFIHGYNTMMGDSQFSFLERRPEQIDHLPSVWLQNTTLNQMSDLKTLEKLFQAAIEFIKKNRPLKARDLKNNFDRDEIFNSGGDPVADYVSRPFRLRNGNASNDVTTFMNVARFGSNRYGNLRLDEENSDKLSVSSLKDHLLYEIGKTRKRAIRLQNYLTALLAQVGAESVPFDWRNADCVPTEGVHQEYKRTMCCCSEPVKKAVPKFRNDGGRDNFIPLKRRFTLRQVTFTEKEEKELAKNDNIVEKYKAYRKKREIAPRDETEFVTIRLVKLKSMAGPKKVWKGRFAPGSHLWSLFDTVIPAVDDIKSSRDNSFEYDAGVIGDILRFGDLSLPEACALSSSFVQQRTADKPYQYVDDFTSRVLLESKVHRKGNNTNGDFWMCWEDFNRVFDGICVSPAYATENPFETADCLKVRKLANYQVDARALYAPSFIDYTSAALSRRAILFNDAKKFAAERIQRNPSYKADNQSIIEELKGQVEFFKFEFERLSSSRNPSDAAAVEYAKVDYEKAVDRLETFEALGDLSLSSSTSIENVKNIGYYRDKLNPDDVSRWSNEYHPDLYQVLSNIDKFCGASVAEASEKYKIDSEAVVRATSFLLHYIFVQTENFPGAVKDYFEKWTTQAMLSKFIAKENIKNREVKDKSATEVNKKAIYTREEIDKIVEMKPLGNNNYSSINGQSWFRDLVSKCKSYINLDRKDYEAIVAQQNNTDDIEPNHTHEYDEDNVIGANDVANNEIPDSQATTPLNLSGALDQSSHQIPKKKTNRSLFALADSPTPEQVRFLAKYDGMYSFCKGLNERTIPLRITSGDLNIQRGEINEALVRTFETDWLIKIASTHTDYELVEDAVRAAIGTNSNVALREGLSRCIAVFLICRQDIMDPSEKEASAAATQFGRMSIAPSAFGGVNSENEGHQVILDNDFDTEKAQIEKNELQKVGLTREKKYTMVNGYEIREADKCNEDVSNEIKNIFFNILGRCTIGSSRQAVVVWRSIVLSLIVCRHQRWAATLLDVLNLTELIPQVERNLEIDRATGHFTVTTSFVDGSETYDDTFSKIDEAINKVDPQFRPVPHAAFKEAEETIKEAIVDTSEKLYNLDALIGLQERFLYDVSVVRSEWNDKQISLKGLISHDEYEERAKGLFTECLKPDFVEQAKFEFTVDSGSNEEDVQDLNMPEIRDADSSNGENVNRLTQVKLIRQSDQYIRNVLNARMDAFKNFNNLMSEFFKFDFSVERHNRYYALFTKCVLDESLQKEKETFKSVHAVYVENKRKRAKILSEFQMTISHLSNSLINDKVVAYRVNKAIVQQVDPLYQELQYNGHAIIGEPKELIKSIF